MDLTGRSDTWQDHKVHGLFADGTYSDDGSTFGAWLVMNTVDTYFGGPLHSDLTVDGIVYNYIVGLCADEEVVVLIDSLPRPRITTVITYQTLHTVSTERSGRNTITSTQDHQAPHWKTCVRMLCSMHPLCGTLTFTMPLHLTFLTTCPHMPVACGKGR